jgi:hypothetical protein
MELEMPRPALVGQRASIAKNEHYPLFNTAYFSIISHDRIKFHVQIDHKWQEYADLNTWAVYIEDDKGHRWYPESTDRARVSMITKMWDREQQTAVRNQYGDIVALNNDGWKNRQSLGSLSIYRGRADFSFYERDIFTADVKSLKLVLVRSGIRFVFIWKFQD